MSAYVMKGSLAEAKIDTKVHQSTFIGCFLYPKERMSGDVFFDKNEEQKTELETTSPDMSDFRTV